MDPVDLALIIALDGSASVTFDEFNLITGAMGAALQDAEVVSSLTGGPAGGSLAALLLWSGTGAHAIMVDWVRIATPKQAELFAQTVTNMPRIVRAGSTAIGEALLVAEQMLAAAPTSAARRVIDVVGDGRSNEGTAPGPVRDRLAAAGGDDQRALRAARGAGSARQLHRRGDRRTRRLRPALPDLRRVRRGHATKAAARDFVTRPGSA